MNTSTPLYDVLRAHSALRPAPFHMPGHKGRCVFQDWPRTFALDVTELPDTGNLYVGGDAIAQAEALWGEVWGYPFAQFLTGGSTQGLHAALLLSAREGKGILVDRCCHRAVYNALALFDLTPSYLLRPQDSPVDPEAVGAALDRAAREGKEVMTFCMTSPTYYGVLSDIPGIAAQCRKRGVSLVVDAAHGCHIPFLREGNPFLGADLVVTSAHKTLPVLGQGAVLFSSGDRFDAGDLRWAASVCGTSSPSYPVMATLDRARAWMESREGYGRSLEAVRRADRFKKGFPSLSGPVDPMRFTLTVNSGLTDGFRVKKALEDEGVFPEMGDRDHVVFLFSGANRAGDFRRLWKELKGLARDLPGAFGPVRGGLLPPEPEVVLSPAQALVARRRPVELAGAEGEVSAAQVAPYPPGVPVIAPGERITKKALSYLSEVGYNVHEMGEVVDAAPRTLF